MLPNRGFIVVNGWGEVFAFKEVKELNRLVFPVFEGPARMHCISAFRIPCFELFPDFFLFSSPSRNFFKRIVRFLSMFSEDLCLGHSLIMISRQAILSSSVDAS